MGSLCSATLIGLASRRSGNQNSTERYERRADTTHNTVKPNQMRAWRRLSISATNAGQANTTTDVAYLAFDRASAKWKARAIAAQTGTRKAASTIGQRLSYVA